MMTQLAFTTAFHDIDGEVMLEIPTPALEAFGLTAGSETEIAVNQQGFLVLKPLKNPT